MLLLSLTHITDSPNPCLPWVCSVYLNALHCKQGSVLHSFSWKILRRGLIPPLMLTHSPPCWCKPTINTEIWQTWERTKQTPLHSLVSKTGRETVELRCKYHKKQQRRRKVRDTATSQNTSMTLRDCLKRLVVRSGQNKSCSGFTVCQCLMWSFRSGI